jgi:hypothetical protein
MDESTIEVQELGKCSRKFRIPNSNQDKIGELGMSFFGWIQSWEEITDVANATNEV